MSGNQATPKTLRRADQTTTGVLIIVTVVYLMVARTFPEGAGVVPQIWGWITLVVALIQFVAPWVPVAARLAGKSVDEEEALVFTDPALRRRFLMIVASLIAIPILGLAIGLPLSLPIYVVAFTLVDRRPLGTVIAATGIISAVSFGLFIVLLQMPWDDGWLWSLL
jgi:hypothetical protein